ncbi:hypothetical protein CR513_52556, partial [Mucuna pruriens]
MGWRIFQLDVKSAFLNGYLEKNVYVEQPMSVVIKEQKEKVLKLKKVLYGLKQAPRGCYNHIDKFDNSDILLVCLNVDDLIFTGNNPNSFEFFKK